MHAGGGSPSFTASAAQRERPLAARAVERKPLPLSARGEPQPAQPEPLFSCTRHGANATFLRARTPPVSELILRTPSEASSPSCARGAPWHTRHEPSFIASAYPGARRASPTFLRARHGRAPHTPTLFPARVGQPSPRLAQRETPPPVLRSWRDGNPSLARGSRARTARASTSCARGASPSPGARDASTPFPAHTCPTLPGHAWLKLPSSAQAALLEFLILARGPRARAA